MDAVEWLHAAAAEAVGGLVGAFALYWVIESIARKRDRRRTLQQVARATSLYGDGLAAEALAIATTLLE